MEEKIGLPLKHLTRKDVYNFIRQRLSFENNIISNLRYVDDDKMKKEHERFEMSGYESKKGECTLSNLSIVNKFADLGIYDYTYYLFLDFYKGTPTLYLKYWGSNENEEFDYTGLD